MKIELTFPHTKNEKDVETPAEKKHVSYRLFLVMAVVVLIIAAVLRGYHLDSKSLWYDEAVAANNSNSTFSQMISNTRYDNSSPVIYPFMLYIVEKVSRVAGVIRLFSALASLLAIAVILALVRLGFNKCSALVSATMLTATASQIRYAQEVREYSLSVLLSAIMVYVFLAWTSGNNRRSGHYLPLYVVLFVAPFVQYGLVIFSVAVIGSMAVLALFNSNQIFKVSHIIISTICLASGSILTFFLTLRYQLGEKKLYLANYYFDPHTTSLPRFIAENTVDVLNFLLPGKIIFFCFVIGLPVYLIANFFVRKIEPVIILFLVTFILSIGVSLAGYYPYGGIRQCIYLAPILTVFAASVLTYPVRWFSDSYRHIFIIVSTLMILFSGAQSLSQASPYVEVEDIGSVLKGLAKYELPNDKVYLYYASVPAVTFYLDEKASTFIQGGEHRDNPSEYAHELLKQIKNNTNRLWLVFSHPYRDEERQITASLESEWEVLRVVRAKNTALYLAQRRVVRE